ncbi:hypothetical protein [Laribacter hongkongensis]|uniref:hypothetical protein n=1 Tax=Laribacter hongkongensis TaxID=168471 RepID=UPI001EFD9242|nr:hypothetical protein [Laribacter hongkongensis]MCG9079156.1 hypothetical protein [Laribacter hongkongensis]
MSAIERITRPAAATVERFGREYCFDAEQGLTIHSRPVSVRDELHERARQLEAALQVAACCDENGNSAIAVADELQVAFMGLLASMASDVTALIDLADSVDRQRKGGA